MEYSVRNEISYGVKSTSAKFLKYASFKEKSVMGHFVFNFCFKPVSN